MIYGRTAASYLFFLFCNLGLMPIFNCVIQFEAPSEGVALDLAQSLNEGAIDNVKDLLEEDRFKSIQMKGFYLSESKRG